MTTRTPTDKIDNESSVMDVTTVGGSVGTTKNPIARALKEVSKGAAEVKKKTVAVVSKGTSNITNVISNTSTHHGFKRKTSFDTIQPNVLTAGSPKSIAASSSSSTTDVPTTTTVVKGDQVDDKITTTTTTTTTSRNNNNNGSKVEKVNVDSSVVTKQKTYARSPPVEVSKVEIKKREVKADVNNNVNNLLTDDAMVVVISVCIIALYPTLMNWYDIIRNNIPFSVMVSWLSVAFAVGYAIGISIGKDEPLPGAASVADVAAVVGRSFRMGRSSDISSLGDGAGGGIGDIGSGGFDVDKQPRRNSFFHFASRGTPKTEQTKSNNSWTNLSSNRGIRRIRFAWETDVDPVLDPKRPNLLNHLMKLKLKKTSRSQLIDRVSSVRDISSVLSGKDEPTTAEAIVDGTNQHMVGKFTAAEATATSFDGDSIDPGCVLRGMDVFLTDDPETEAGTHPWLIEHGLRDVPTFILNFYTQWGNMLFYFELPSFVTDWNLVENDTDPDDVKALKRFFMGDDEYRNLRLKLMPFVVDAPSAVKMFAPAKGAQVTMKSDRVQVSWKKYDKETCSKSGKQLSIAIEGVVDLVETRFVRSAASLIKGHLQRLLVDCALIVSTPEKQVEEEPMACLGIFRLNRVLVSSCPQMPDRFEKEAATNKVSPSLMRASVMMGLNSEEVAKLAERSEV